MGQVGGYMNSGWEVECAGWMAMWLSCQQETCLSLQAWKLEGVVCMIGHLMI